MWKENIKEYFFELGNELSELSSNILNTLKTKKWIMILSGIILFILGCFIWRPLCLLIITGAFMLCATFSIMLIPFILSILTILLFHLGCLDGDEYYKYPLLTTTVSFICGFIVLGLTTYTAYDIAIRDLWYQPELWNQILSL